MLSRLTYLLFSIYDFAYPFYILSVKMTQSARMLIFPSNSLITMHTHRHCHSAHPRLMQSGCKPCDKVDRFLKCISGSLYWGDIFSVCLF